LNDTALARARILAKWSRDSPQVLGDICAS
jgi:hypothetical protein